MRMILGRMILGTIAGAAITIAMVGSVMAQAAPPAASGPVEVPPAAETASPEAIVAAVYAVISGPADNSRDWAKMRGLFVLGGTLAAAGQPRDKPASVRVMTVDEYIARAAPNMSKSGFYERGVTGKVWRYGHIAAVNSPYESRHTPSDAKPFARGINHFSLFNDGTRWWVVAIYWEGESPAAPLPPEAEAMLKAK